MRVSAKLEVDWSRNFHYIARKRSVTDDRQIDRQTDNGVYTAARSQLKIKVILSLLDVNYTLGVTITSLSLFNKINLLNV